MFGASVNTFKFSRGEIRDAHLEAQLTNTYAGFQAISNIVQGYRTAFTANTLGGLHSVTTLNQLAHMTSSNLSIVSSSASDAAAGTGVAKFQLLLIKLTN